MECNLLLLKIFALTMHMSLYIFKPKLTLNKHMLIYQKSKTRINVY